MLNIWNNVDAEEAGLLGPISAEGKPVRIYLKAAEPFKVIIGVVFLWTGPTTPVWF